MRASDIPNFDELSDLDRVRLAGELIASIRKPEALPAPIAHRIELERRWSEYERNPSLAVSEEEFWARLPSGEE